MYNHMDFKDTPKALESKSKSKLQKKKSAMTVNVLFAACLEP